MSTVEPFPGDLRSEAERTLQANPYHSQSDSILKDLKDEDDDVEDPMHDAILRRHLLRPPQSPPQSPQQSPQRTIFDWGSQGQASVFKLHPPSAYQTNLPQTILRAGGLLIDSLEEDPFAILLVDGDAEEDADEWEEDPWPPQEAPCPPPRFRSQFLVHSCNKGAAQDLNKYRIPPAFHSDSLHRIYEQVDANLVLRREVPWSRLLNNSRSPGTEPSPTTAAQGSRRGRAKEAGRVKREPTTPRRIKTPKEREGRAHECLAGSSRRSFRPSPTPPPPVPHYDAPEETVRVDDVDNDSDSDILFLGEVEGRPPPPREGPGEFEGGRLSPLMLDGVDLLGGAQDEEPPFSPSRKKAFSNRDRVRLLRYIRRFKLFDFVKGNKIWRRMERIRALGGRFSWQSMREHFTKYMMRRLLEEDSLCFGATEQDRLQLRNLNRRLGQTPRDVRQVPDYVLERIQNIDHEHNPIDVVEIN